jgi:hypothetical protein
LSYVLLHGFPSALRSYFHRAKLDILNLNLYKGLVKWILNSVFVFFIETVEILNRFEHGIFQMTKIFKHRYIRQGVIIISVFLFLLSSFEWIRGQEINTSDSNSNALQFPQKTFKSISFNKATKATDCLKKSCIALRPLANIYPLPNASTYSTSVKRYLLIRSILI